MPMTYSLVKEIGMQTAGHAGPGVGPPRKRGATGSTSKVAPAAPDNRSGEQSTQYSTGGDLSALIQDYHARGLSVVPTVGKKPAVRWEAYMDRLPTETELRLSLSKPGVSGVAVVIGPGTWEANPGLYILEVEGRHREQAEPWL